MVDDETIGFVGGRQSRPAPPASNSALAAAPAKTPLC